MSNQPKHTPLPWKPAGELATHILDFNRRMIADAPHPNGMSQEEGYANRDLICAAPDQYHEMRRYLPVLERAESDPELWANLTEGLGIATLNGYRAAIAKAEGRGV